MIKEKIKRVLLDKLHAVEVQPFDLVEAVTTRGVRGYAELDFKKLKADLLNYMQSVKVAPFTYKYAVSCEKPCLYASIYAVMLEGLLGVLDKRTKDEKKAWAEYLNSFQSEEDGLYYDPSLEGSAYEHIGVWNEGWGKHHLMGHMIIALARLGVTPKYPLKYLEKYYDKEYLVKWMDSFDFSTDVWTASNYFMNLYTVLEYARDYMDEARAKEAVDTMTEWILQRQNPETGMWHTQKWDSLDHLGKLNVVRAAYHFYPLFEYEGIENPYARKVIEHIIPLQNSWGGWTIERGNAGACEDIDAIEPLLRYASACPELEEEIQVAIRRSMVWQLACRNQDKGFSFYLRSSQEYGGHPITSSRRDESSMFATWFRTLCLAYEMRYLGIGNAFNIGRFPGYEIS